MPETRTAAPLFAPFTPPGGPPPSPLRRALLRWGRLAGALLAIGGVVALLGGLLGLRLTGPSDVQAQATALRVHRDSVTDHRLDVLEATVQGLSQGQRTSNMVGCVLLRRSDPIMASVLCADYPPPPSPRP